MKYKLRPINQQKCYDMALNKDIFLIAAKCRFGKTFVASKIVCDGWFAKDYSKKILVISGFSSIRKEWEETIQNQFPECKDLFGFETIQYLKVGKGCDEVIKEYKSCYLIFDEAHFGEQTEKTQHIIHMLNPSKVLYLTATPYTDSLMTKFKNTIGVDDSNTFSYSIQDEFEDYFKDPELFKRENGYTPVEMKLNILENDDIVYNTKKGFAQWTSTAVTAFKKELDSKSYNTFMYFVKEKKEGDALKKIFKKYFPGLEIFQLTGEDDDNVMEIGDAKAGILNAKQQGSYAMVVACKRGGTGVTWKGLDCVCFYDAPNSAIDFIQKSYRCATPVSDKTSATIYCFNKTSALKMYLKMNKLEAAKKGVSEKENFEAFQKYFQLEGTFAEFNFSNLIATMCEKFDYLCADFDGVDLSNCDKAMFKGGKGAEKSVGEYDQGSEKEGGVKDNVKEKPAGKDVTQAEEIAKKNFFQKFIKLKKVLSFYKKLKLTDWDIDFANPKTYTDTVWLKITQSFTKDQWTRFLENNKPVIEALELKECAKVGIQNTSTRAVPHNSKSTGRIINTIEDLMEKYPEATNSTVKEISTRHPGLQATLKKANLAEYGICFGCHPENAEFAHITPFSEVKCTKDVYDFNNGICIPHSLHYCWDTGVVKLVPDEEGYITVEVVKNTDDTEPWKGIKSNYKLSKEQLYFLNKRKYL